MLICTLISVEKLCLIDLFRTRKRDVTADFQAEDILEDKRAKNFIRSTDKRVEGALVFFAGLREIWTN